LEKELRRKAGSAIVSARHQKAAVVEL